MDRMKNLILMGLLLLTSFAFGQEIEYLYDDAGNRIQRKVFVLGGGGPSSRLAGPQEELAAEITEDFKLTIYPNPVKENVTFQIIGEFTPYQVSIIDLAGKEILNTTINEANKQLNLSHFPKGIYIIRTSLEKEFAEWKIIKQ